MFQTKVVEKIKTHFMFKNCFPKNRIIYEIMWSSRCTQDTSVNIIAYGAEKMQFPCRIPKERLETHVQNI
jgi:hypothetical protein